MAYKTQIAYRLVCTVNKYCTYRNSDSSVCFFFPAALSVEIYTKETLVGTSYVEEQKCGGDAARLVTPKPGE